MKPAPMLAVRLRHSVAQRYSAQRLTTRKLLITVLAMLALLAACTREESSPIRIGTNVWIGSEPLYLARGLEYLDSRQIRLVEYPSASEVLRAFRNQAIDGMIVSVVLHSCTHLYTNLVSNSPVQCKRGRGDDTSSASG
mgnify:CR=1 FL=1